jgi:hypothetical protein
MGDLLAEPEFATTAEPFLAWRTWALAGSRDGAEVRLMPIVGGTHPWPARVPNRASCALRRRHGEVPEVHCSCGLYGTDRDEVLRRTRSPAVLGRVALWGRIVEHTLGYRAEYAYPQRLRLVCFVCFWRRGTNAEACDAVIRRRGGRLVPLCAPDVELAERYGYPVRDRLPAREVEQALLSAYAVDRLAPA